MDKKIKIYNETLVDYAKGFIFDILTYNQRELKECNIDVNNQQNVLMRLTYKQIEENFLNDLPKISEEIRISLAEGKLFLEYLIYDECNAVRHAVVDQWYGWKELINDTSWFVRLRLVEKGYALNVLIKDEDDDVRRAAVAKCIGVLECANDPNEEIRKMVRDGIKNVLFPDERN